MKSKVVTLDVLQEFKNRFKDIVIKESTEKIPQIEISIENMTELISKVENRIPQLSDDGNSIIFDTDKSFTHQSLEGYINKDNIEEIVADKGFSKLTLDTVKADESFSQLIANKDKYLTEHLTKDEIEALNLDYTKLDKKPVIPSDIKDLNDSAKLLLTIDNVKNDDEFNDLLINKDNFALKSNLPSKLSDLDNDTNFTTLADVKTDSELAHKTDIITSYLDLKDKPSIPSDISDLDDSNNIILTLSKIKEDDAFAQLISNKDKYLTEHQDITHLANKQDIVKSYNDLLDTPSIPSKVSDLTNDSNYQTAANVETIISTKGYQTAQDVELSISGKGYKTESDINLIISGKGFQTASDFINALKEKGILNSDGNVSISSDKISGLGLLATKDTLSAQEVGARPNTWTPTAQEVGVPEWARAANKPTYTASEVGAKDSTYTPTASEISSAIGDATGLMKASIRYNMGLGSLATKSSITPSELADELKAMKEAVNCLLAAQDETFITHVDSILLNKDITTYKYSGNLEEYIPSESPNPK